MPVLGIPGWYADSDRESFYDDADHFRGKGFGPRSVSDTVSDTERGDTERGPRHFLRRMVG